MDYRYRILHVADPHFSYCHFKGIPSDSGRRHAEELLRVLEENELLFQPFDALVLSGDFTFAAEAEGFEAAEVFIDILAQWRSAEDTPLVKPGGILVIPGNHDVNLGKQVTIKQLSLPLPKHEAEDKFRSFLARIQKHVGPANHWLSMGIRAEQQDAPGLVIVGLNSSRAERHDAQGWGYVGMDQIQEVATRLSGSMAGHAKEGDIVLAVTHHNLLPIWDLSLEMLNNVPEQRKFSFTMDAAATMNLLTGLGASVMLHGHTHVQSVKAIEGYGPEGLRDYPTLVLGAGSFGIRARLGDLYPPPHHFQLIEIEGSNNRMPQLTYSDLATLSDSKGTPQFYPEDKPRIWGNGPPSRVHWLYTSWNPVEAQRALKRKAFEIKKGEIASENVESWAVLRDRELNPAVWQQTLTSLYERVHAIDNSVTPTGVSQAVEQLFITPPTARDLCEWMLEQYLALNMARLCALFAASSAS